MCWARLRWVGELPMAGCCRRQVLSLALEKEGPLVTYGCMASMKTRAGSRDEVVSILLSAVDGLREAGCDIYLVGLSEDDDVTIWVTEVWRTKEHHDASLELPGAKAAIGEAMPMLTGEFTKQELSVVGGLGL
jgi:quinol monooxygenase YgiN